MAGFIQVSADGRGFVESGTGEWFVPFGANYFDPKVGWAPKIWSRYNHDTVERQLTQIARAGLNCVRVFLDFKTLAPEKKKYSAEGFAKVEDMIRTAGKLGIRIDFSGPSTWEGPPDYLKGDEYADPRMDLTCDMLRELGKRFGQDPTIMTWDLRNEPMVGFVSKDKGDWVAPRLRLWQQHARQHLGVEVDDFPAWDKSDLRTMREYVRFLEGLADEWVRKQCEALRSTGIKQMISVGSIQWVVPIHIGHWASYACFDHKRFAQHLDYLSVHFYPMLINPRQSIEKELPLQKIYVEIVARGAYIPGKPLVIEEFGWKGGKQVPRDSTGAWPQEEQSIWGDALMEVTSRVACGWLNWGYADAADPNADISAASGLWTEDEQLKHWGQRFAQWATKLKNHPPQFQPAKKQWKIDKVEYLAKHNGLPKMQALADMLAADPTDSVEVVFTD